MQPGTYSMRQSSKQRGPRSQRKFYRTEYLEHQVVTFLNVLVFRFGMMITSLNVINVFTDEFDQVKAEGKLVDNDCGQDSQVTHFLFRCYCDIQLHDGSKFDDQRRDLDADLRTGLHRGIYAARIHQL